MGISCQPLGSAGRMRKIQDFSGFFDETTLVICGDAIVDLDIRSALDEHRARARWQRDHAGGAARAGQELRGGGDRQERAGRVLPGEALARGGPLNPRQYRHLHFRAAGARPVPSGKTFDIGSELFPLLVEQGLPFFAQTRFYQLDRHRSLGRLLVGAAARAARRDRADGNARHRSPEARRGVA